MAMPRGFGFQIAFNEFSLKLDALCMRVRVGGATLGGYPSA